MYYSSVEEIIELFNTLPNAWTDGAYVGFSVTSKKIRASVTLDPQYIVDSGLRELDILKVKQHVEQFHDELKLLNKVPYMGMASFSLQPSKKGYTLNHEIAFNIVDTTPFRSVYYTAHSTKLDILKLALKPSTWGIKPFVVDVDIDKNEMQRELKDLVKQFKPHVDSINKRGGDAWELIIDYLGTWYR